MASEKLPVALLVQDLAEPLDLDLCPLVVSLDRLESIRAKAGAIVDKGSLQVIRLLGLLGKLRVVRDVLVPHRGRYTMRGQQKVENENGQRNLFGSCPQME